MTDQTPHESPHESPNSTKSSLPRWALALILGAGVLFIGGILSIIVAVTLLASVFAADNCSSPESCGQELSPTPSAERPGVAGAPSSSVDRIPLDGSADFGGPPVWNVLLDPSWEILKFDENGVNMFQNADSGCLLLTSQNEQDVAPVEAGDRVASEQLLSQQIDTFAAVDPNASVLDSRSVDIAVGAAGSGSTIEFSSATLQRTLSSGNAETMELIARSLPASGSFMWAVVSCETGIYEAGESPFTGITKVLAVTVDF
ncbi:hypothetical protein FB472_2001 [Rhodoglobus vestalii]|uniref:Uncharacterized protein n=1 Tax=Rhodoglobus vestalii TaxID=193384 RepID=A0A8H2K586_9MICO|nr:hypothetical protein [Rhodoglobus vestalii]TQO20370.1 hypothetical protein FB472_2001 [Rhodoglobus vestalii]